MRRLLASALAVGLLSGCAIQNRPAGHVAAASPIAVQILAINDFHGNIQTPSDPVTVVAPTGEQTARLGGAAQLAGALEQARLGHANTITVAAGDLIGASPLESAYFLDEPTVDAMTMLGLSVASVGNHEFDKGSSELLRMQNGGCTKYTSRVPCRVEPFAGAGFEYLAANVLKADGTTLFPATAIRQVGPIRIGFIGETLKNTGEVTTPAGVTGLHFADEADTANALVPKLKAAGVDAIVLLLHQGGKLPGAFHLDDCNGLSGDILPILSRLDPAITTVISGHTHNGYACSLQAGGATRLLTSAGKYGYLYTDVELRFDPATHRMTSETAANVPVTGTAGVDPKIEALVSRYVAAAAPAAARIVGHLPAPLSAVAPIGHESPAADLIADAQLAATSKPAGANADLSFINTGGVRTSLDPASDGTVTFGQIFAMEPFGNDLVVKSLTGAQIKALLEQQFAADGALRESILVPSANFHFAYDRSRPAGDRIVSMSLNGQPLQPDRTYRVSVNNFLSSGGDGYTVLNQGGSPFDAGIDLDALEAWLATSPAIPTPGRMKDVTPRT